MPLSDITNISNGFTYFKEDFRRLPFLEVFYGFNSTVFPHFRAINIALNSFCRASDYCIRCFDYMGNIYLKGVGINLKCHNDYIRLVFIKPAKYYS